MTNRYGRGVRARLARLPTEYKLVVQCSGTMVRTSSNTMSRVAAAFHYKVTTVTANVDIARKPPFTADHYDRNLSGVAGHVIPRHSKFGERSDVVPAFSKDLADFFFSDRGVCIPPRRK